MYVNELCPLSRKLPSLQDACCHHNWAPEIFPEALCLFDASVPFFWKYVKQTSEKSPTRTDLAVTKEAYEAQMFVLAKA